MNNSYASADFKWVSEAFESMVKELESDPEKYGYLGGDQFMSTNPYTNGPSMIQYWRSQEHLNAYAKSRMNKHFQPMLKSAKQVRESSAYGFYHESFRIHAGEYDCVYMNMPRTLLGAVGELYDMKGKLRTAAGRAGLSTAAEDEKLDVYRQIDAFNN